MANKKEAPARRELVVVQGKVIRCVFHNKENGFCILKVNSGGDGDMFDDGQTVKGTMPAVREGDEYKFTGYYVQDAKYGQQLMFQQYELILPTTRNGLAVYLSRVTSGVGLVKAQRIIEDLGEDCLEKIKADPAVLDSLPYLNDKQRDEIAADLQINEVYAELAALICKHGIGMGTVAKIYKHYANKAVQNIKENPYALCEDLWGVGFKTADAIAMSVGIGENSPHRVEAAVLYALRQATGEGHVYLDPNSIKHELLDAKDALLKNSGVGISDVSKAVRQIIGRKKCIREGDAIYAVNLYLAECMVAQKVAQKVVQMPGREIPGLDEMITTLEQIEGIQCGPEQRQAVKSALQHSLSILTGGPGTGKTFTINAIVNIYAQLNPDHPIYLAAPTGRAAKRMSESAGREAMTIHRLLAYSPRDNGFTFNADNPLPGPGLIIIDESSMMDIELSASLLEAAPDLQTVFVGDIDQLPSVGPGSVLRDLIACNKVAVTRLSFNYRQAGGSQIAARANGVARGEKLTLDTQGDFHYVPAESGDDAAATILTLAQDAVKEGRGLLDWQVLVPMNRASCGVDALNEKIRAAINPEVEGGPKLGKFRLGDKVMVVRNNYGLNVFNGDLGVVEAIEHGKMYVNFSDRTQEFGRDDLDIVTFAYAITIHKFQGSQCPLVIMGLTTQHYMLLQRNLLYTGLTRAQHKLILVADPKAADIAVKTNESKERFSLLAERINKLLT